jgi:hypothetical protein
MNIEVSNCHECPFCNNDNEYGRDECNLSEKVDDKLIEGSIWQQLPYDSVHYRCPLKRLNQVTVKIKKK